MREPLDVREARGPDAAAVSRLVGELAASIGESSPVTEPYASSWLAAPGTVAFVAARGGEVLGLATCSVRPNLYHAAPCCLIEELVVTGAARGSGIGAALVDRVVAFAKASGCAEISVSTGTGNRGALSLYHRAGFTDEAILLERHFTG